jgi:hypothetical protein
MYLIKNDKSIPDDLKNKLVEANEKSSLQEKDQELQKMNWHNRDGKIKGKVGSGDVMKNAILKRLNASKFCNLYSSCSIRPQTPKIKE